MGDEKLLREIGIRINMRRRELRLTQEQLDYMADAILESIDEMQKGI